jgi:diguanylate cyclase (GGDEF)-like protein/PAS domain S-box-containing protein
MVTPAPEIDYFADLKWRAGFSPELGRAATARLAAEPSGSAVLVHGPEGKVVAANLLAQQLLGLSWETLVGLAPLDARWKVVTEDGVPLPGSGHPALRVLSSGQSVRADLLGVLVPPVEARWLEVTAHPLPAAQGQAGQWCGALTLFSDVSLTPRGQRAFGTLVQAYRLMAENSSDVVVRVTRSGVCQWVSPSVAAAIGWRPAQLHGRPLLDFVHPGDVHTVLDGWEQLLSTGGERHSTVRLRTADGSYRWMSALWRIDMIEGRAPVGIIALRDVHEEVAETARVAASERRYRMLTENSTDVILYIQDGMISWATPSVRAALGFEPEELAGSSVWRVIHAEDQQSLLRAKSQLQNGEIARTALRMVRVDGTTSWFDAVSRLFLDESGQADGFVIRLRDIANEVATRRRLEHLAGHDSLTGLVNRQELADRMRKILPITEPGQPTIAIAFCDVDHFKSVNDSYGHETGDQLLREIAERVTGVVRAADIVARLGGDELVVVLDGIREMADAAIVMEKIRLRVCEPMTIGDAALNPSLSIGVSLVRPGEPFEMALRRADAAVYEAKTLGRNRIQLG